jgi:xylitol oxidase
VNKRTFIKLCSAAATSCVIRPLMLAWAAGNKLKNWAGNFEYGTERVYSPHSLV